MEKLNAFDVILAAVFVLPILRGALNRFSRERISYAVWSLLDGLAFIVALGLAVYLTRGIFFNNEAGLFKQIYEYIPAELRTVLFGRDVLVYLLAVPIMFWLLRSLLGLIIDPLYKHILEPLGNRLFLLLTSSGAVLRHTIGALAQLPKAGVWVLVGALLLNFYAYYFPNPLLAQQMNGSEVYQFIKIKAVQPLLNADLTKKLPVLVNDYFRPSTVEPPPQASSNGRVITYFNGVTLDEAVKSNADIDATARSIIGEENNPRQQAYLLYRWISRNITYDYDKAAQLSQNPDGMESGAIVAFNSRTGVCFDYASLYVAMCRAAGLQVRLVTGLGYSGLVWGDHAWNQVYIPEENQWINVDCTFGVQGDYFDNTDFDSTHQYAQVQGEW
ncbi:MAG TPA: transglutaminase-like domain-containing protein [Syntrophomonas sp.]|nr:transglutaminase-like domain-containing protein [Syntrophomonas sp.]